MAKTFWLSATFLAAAAQSSQVAFGPGISTPSLLEQRLVDEAAGQRQLRHEAGDGVRAVRTHPVGLGAKIVLPIFRVGEVGAKIEPVLG